MLNLYALEKNELEGCNASNMYVYLYDQVKKGSVKLTGRVDQGMCRKKL